MLITKCAYLKCAYSKILLYIDKIYRIFLPVKYFLPNSFCAKINKNELLCKVCFLSIWISDQVFTFWIGIWNIFLCIKVIMVIYNTCVILLSLPFFCFPRLRSLLFNFLKSIKCLDWGWFSLPHFLLFGLLRIFHQITAVTW